MAHTNQQNDPRQLGERLLTRKLAWTKRAIFFENLWLKLWPLFIVIAVYMIASLFEFWDMLSPLAHRFVLALFVFAAMAALYPLASLRWPAEAEALKRLDKNSILPHQPAQAFKDNLTPDQENHQTLKLWTLFKQRLVDKIKSLSVPFPRPNTAEKDPYALRMVLLFTVAVGLFIQGGNLMPLLSKSWAIPPLLDTRSLRIDAWVTPPNYTDQPPILVSNGAIQQNEKPDAKVIKVPENAIFTVRINGKNADRLALKTSSENAQTDKDKNQKAEPETQEFTVKLTRSGPISLSADEVPLTKWDFEVIEDTPPMIGLIEPPTKARSGALKLEYKVADDYGVLYAKAHYVDVTIEGRKPDANLPEHEKPLGKPPEYTLNLPELITKQGEGETYKDLTRHPWAGLITTLYLTATDEGGNTTKSPVLELKLPEYKFTKPLAKNIIRLRKQLIIAPHRSGSTANSLLALTANKQPFQKDLSLYLGMRVAAVRLYNAQKRDEKEEIAEMLYELARHIEDGDLSKAEQALRTAQEALRDALKNNASQQELEKRIEELRKALSEYMQALAKKQQNQNAQNQQNGQDNKINPQDLDQMLKTIEELAKSGSKDLARQMLSQMQNMLENMQTGQKQQGGDQSDSAKELQELGKLLRQQQKLMDKTYNQRRNGKSKDLLGQQSDKQSNQDLETKGIGDMGQSNQRGQNNSQNPGQENSLAQQQQTLKEKLDQLMRQMRRRNNSQSLDNAGKAMERAQKMLENNDLSGALSEEGNALDQLRQGMQDIAKQMAQKKGGGGGQKRQGTDPMGRNQGEMGLDTSDSTRVPDKIDIQRAREILRNLQEKMSDPNRRSLEIEYFERLLKRF